MKAKFGNTDYYIVSMKAKELVERTIFPDQVPGWRNMILEEIEQRDINYSRVKSQIAPYLAKNEDRFFGAIILTATGLDKKSFESLEKVVKDDLLNVYKTQAEMMGFLTFKGGETLIPLDGQHRIKAIKFAIEGKDGEKKIKGFQPNLDLANEDVTVIIVPYERKRARNIFTKVNRYAKPTTTGQNLVTDDDDIIAILSRLVTNEIIGARLVNYKSNTLIPKPKDDDRFFTTLSTLANCNVAILNANFGPVTKTERDSLVAPDKGKMYENKVMETWKFLMKNIALFDGMLKNDETGDEKRREFREDYLISRPIAQLCLVSAYAKLTNLSSTSENPKKRKLTEKEAVEKLNKINWAIDAPIWDRLLVAGKKNVITKAKNKRVATDIICYMAGEHLTEKEKGVLLQEYRDLLSDDKVKLPSQV